MVLVNEFAKTAKVATDSAALQAGSSGGGATETVELFEDVHLLPGLRQQQLEGVHR